MRSGLALKSVGKVIKSSKKSKAELNPITAKVITRPILLFMGV